MQGAKHYRNDIDGLRALAVALVVLYHLRVPGFAGGFVGVDVFFVISGFVVTRMLTASIGAGTFAFGRFYVNRFWRLQPAFLLVTATTLAASAWLLMPADLFRTAQSAVAACLAVANIFFWLHGGAYGGPLAEQQPFLHAWSLAVEEQFYLIWPLLLWLGTKRRVFQGAASQVGALAGLLVLSEYLARAFPSAAYYLLPARLMELGLGAALVTAEAKLLPVRVALPAKLVGLALILGSNWLLRDDSTFPGVSAAVPCAGAGLLIWAGSTQTLMTRWTGHPVAQHLGRASYSLYLWHWPPIALANYLGVEFTPWVQLQLGASALVLALATFRWWEAPTRREPTRFFRMAVFSLLGVVALGAVLVLRPGSEARIAASKRENFDETKNQISLSCLFDAKTWAAIDSCGGVEPQPGNKRVLVWGDSHARVLGKAFTEKAKLLGYTPTVMMLSGCPPLLGVHRVGKQKSAALCNESFGEQVQAFIDRHAFDAIVVVARFGIYERGNLTRGRRTHLIADAQTQTKRPKDSAKVLRRSLKKTAHYLARKRKARVFLLLPTPNLPKAPHQDGRHELRVARASYLKERSWFDRVAKQLPRRIHLIDPQNAVCEGKWCPVWDESGQALYDDDNHLSPLGAERLIPLFQKALRR